MKEYQRLKSHIRMLEGRIKKGEALDEEKMPASLKKELDKIRREKRMMDDLDLWIQRTTLVSEEIITKFEKIATSLEDNDFDVTVPNIKKITALKKIVDDTKTPN